MHSRETGGRAVSAEIPSWGRTFLRAWALGCILVAVVGTAKLALTLRRGRLETARYQAARMDPGAPDIGLTPPQAPPRSAGRPIPVRIGVYVERVPEVAIPNDYWIADFDLWFRWTGDAFDPEGFEVVDGWIEDVELEERFASGDAHYAIYHVQARISKYYDVRCFPCDNHQLLIEVEHPAYLHHQVCFVADEDECAVSSRVHVPGYQIRSDEAIVKPHSYQSRRGDPRLPKGEMATYSQFRYAFHLERTGLEAYLKMFQMLFVAVGVALLPLFITLTEVDPRFGLGVGALFAAVANTYIVSTMVPETGQATLADMVNFVSVALILVTIIQSTVSLHLYEGRGKPALSRRFDRLSFWVFLLLYVPANLVLLWAARG